MNAKLNPRDFIHEDDRKALEALRGIPGFDSAVKAFMKVFNEKQFRIQNMSSKIRLSQRQCPEIYKLLPPICDKFGIEVPELYLEANRMPNAYTSGDTDVFITITTGLLEVMREEEVEVVLAHECGHILCHHVLYHTMGQFLLGGAASLFGLKLITESLKVAFMYWMRCSEFSADRAAAIYCEDSEPVVNILVRLAGGNREISREIDPYVFMEQALEYEEFTNDSTWNKVLEYLATMNLDHPFIAIRASRINEWCRTPRFNEVVKGLKNSRYMIADSKCCPSCGAPISDGWVFCKKCGAPLRRPGARK